MIEVSNVLERLCNYLKEQQIPEGAIRDPTFGILRYRSTAEAAAAFMEMGNREWDKRAKLALDWVVKQQHESGYWDEIHPGDARESVLETAVVGRVLAVAFQRFKHHAYLEAAMRAGEYVLANELLPGFWKKSLHFFPNTLNNTATVVPFLQNLFILTGDERYEKARQRAVFNTVRWQFPDGAFPYSADVSFPYDYHRNVRDIHYHAITMHMLLSGGATDSLSLHHLKRAATWLKLVSKNGRFNWRHSDLSVSQKFVMAYGYSAAALRLLEDKEASLFLDRLSELQLPDGSFRRYERTSPAWCFRGGLRDVLGRGFMSNHSYKKIIEGRTPRWRDHLVPKPVNSYGYPLSARLFLAGNRFYREWKSRSDNFVDMYTTAQVADVLATAFQPTS